MKNKKALFLDRDGVVNIDKGYVYKKEDIEFVDGIFELCKYVNSKNYLIFIITNQAGIGRGFYTEVEFTLLTDWIEKVFLSKGIKIDKTYFCPYHEKYGIGKYLKNSFDRKPNPGMILKASKENSINLSNSILIGDKISDILAGQAAGIGKNILFDVQSKQVLENKKFFKISKLLDSKIFFI